jgi:hypothetical protein
MKPRDALGGLGNRRRNQAGFETGDLFRDGEQFDF